MQASTRDTEIQRINVLSLTTLRKMAEIDMEYASAQFGAKREVLLMISATDHARIDTFSSIFRHPLVCMRDAKELWRKALMSETETKFSAEDRQEIAALVRQLNTLSLLIVREQARDNLAVTAANFFCGQKTISEIARMSYEEVIDIGSRLRQPVVCLMEASTGLWRRLLQVDPDNRLAIQVFADHLRVKGLSATHH